MSTVRIYDFDASSNPLGPVISVGDNSNLEYGVHFSAKL